MCLSTTPGFNKIDGITWRAPQKHSGRPALCCSASVVLKKELVSLSGTEVLLFTKVRAPVVSKSHSAHLALIETLCAILKMKCLRMLQSAMAV